jgi:hypothetical protein
VEAKMSRFQENVTLLCAITFSLGFIVCGISGFDEWLTGDGRYLKDSAFAVLFLGVALLNLWQWRRRRREQPPMG